MAPWIIRIYISDAAFHSGKIKKSVKFKIDHNTVLNTAKHCYDHASFSENKHARIDDYNQIEK